MFFTHKLWNLILVAGTGNFFPGYFMYHVVHVIQLYLSVSDNRTEVRRQIQHKLNKENQTFTMEYSSTTLLIRHLPEELSDQDKINLMCHFGAKCARPMGTKGKLASVLNRLQKTGYPEQSLSPQPPVWKSATPAIQLPEQMIWSTVN